MAAELKPCPFCGGEALLEEFSVRKGFEACIVCNNCLVTMPTITYDTQEEATEAVIDDWNRRAAKTPCDLCKFNPPTSMDGKPCTMCVADWRAEDGK